MADESPRQLERGSKPIADAPAAPPSDDGFARDLRGFGVLGLLAVVLILLGNALFLPFSAILVLVWVRLSRTPWRDIGYVRPRSWLLTVVGGVAMGIAFKFTMKAVVMPLLGADPINHAYHYLAGNRAALPGAIYLMIAGAGFGEETMFRGYFFERFGKLLGTGTAALTATVLIVSLGFGAAHYSMQGLAGAEQATIVGLVFGVIRVMTGRIPFLMVAHAAFDLTAVAMIYWDLETRVAHLVFR